MDNATELHALTKLTYTNPSKQAMIIYIITGQYATTAPPSYLNS